MSLDLDPFATLGKSIDADLDKVAEAILQRATNRTDLHCGIIAFYTTQREAIYEWLKKENLTKEVMRERLHAMHILLLETTLRLHQRCLEMIQTTVANERNKNNGQEK